MKAKGKPFEGWCSWVISPGLEPYLNCILHDTKEDAKRVFRGGYWKGAKIIHSRITIQMPPAVAKAYDRYQKDNCNARYAL